MKKVVVKKYFLTIALVIWTVALFCGAMPTQAAVVIEGTRVIYNENQREVNVKLNNVDEKAGTLVQIWIDEDNIDATPNTSGVPFILNPPLAKIGAGKKQQVRIVYVGENENYKQEKLYWLNILEVPPKSNEPSSLSFAVRTRVKLFFRPKVMNGMTPNAPENTVWRWTSSKEPYEIEAHNTSQFHISMPSVFLEGTGAPIELSRGTMVAPNERARFKVEGLTQTPNSSMKIRHNSLNDFGAETFHVKEISSSK